jgi:hypothetical protein
MLTTGEQRELRLIEEELQNTDRRFTRRLTMVQGLLRWAAPGRQARLLILAALAAALVRFAAAAERLLRELARGAVLMEPAILVIPGGTAWPDWEPEQPPCHGVRQAQVGRGPAGRARHEHAGKHGRLPGDPGTEAMQHRDQPGQRKPPARSDGRGENVQEQPDVPS